MRRGFLIAPLQREEAEEVRASQNSTVLDIIRDCLDIPAPLFGLQKLSPNATGYVGLAGTVSSAISVYQVYRLLAFDDVHSFLYLSARRTGRICLDRKRASDDVDDDDE